MLGCSLWNKNQKQLKEIDDFFESAGTSGTHSLNRSAMISNITPNSAEEKDVETGFYA